MLLTEMQNYFKAERAGNWVALAIGLKLLIFIIVFKDRIASNLWLKGFSYSLVFLFLFSVANTFSIYNNTRRLRVFTAAFEQDPRSLVRLELRRMINMESWWLPLNITWTCLLTIGLVGIALTKRPFISGLLVGIGLVGLMGFVSDRVSKKNADDYTRQLRGESKGLERDNR